TLMRQGGEKIRLLTVLSNRDRVRARVPRMKERLDGVEDRHGVRDILKALGRGPRHTSVARHDLSGRVYVLALGVRRVEVVLRSRHVVVQRAAAELRANGELRLTQRKPVAAGGLHVNEPRCAPPVAR